MASVPTGGASFNPVAFVAQLGISYLLGRATAQDGPRLSNLEATSGEYGVPMPRIYGGAVRLATPWMALDDIKETEHEVEDYSEVVGAISGAAQGFLVGGPVGAVVGAVAGFLFGSATPNQKYYTYSITGAVLFADRTGAKPIEGALKAWSTGRTIFDASELSPSSTTLDSNGDLRMVEYPANKYFNRLRIYGGGDEQTGDSILNAAPGIDEDQPGYIFTAYAVFEDFQLEYFGNSIPAFEWLVKAKEGETVAEFLTSVGNVAGINTIQELSSALMANEVIQGYAITSESTCWDAIKPIQPIYGFDSAEIAGGVSFFPRGRGMRATIPVEHMGAYEWGQDPPLRYRFSDVSDTNLPKETHLTFIDPGRDYQSNTAAASRVLGDADTISSVTIGVTLDADSAASAVSLMHWDAWLGRKMFATTLTDEWLSLQPGVTYAIPVDNQHMPFRVSGVTRGPKGLIELEAFSDEDIVYAATETLNSGTTPGTSTLFPTTYAVFMDMPMTEDAHDDYGFYVAMGSNDSTWQRGAVLVSSDNINFATLLDHDQKAIMGVSQTVIPAGATTGWDNTLDTTTTITVDLYNPDDVLSSATDAELDSYANFIFLGKDGVGEYIQFKTATFISGSTWELTNLRRGRRGTEWYMDQHVADEQMVLLGQGGIYRIPVNDDTGWGDTLYFKGVSLFQNPDDVTSFDEVNTGEGKRPFSPINLTGEFVAGDLELAWTDRERFYDVANSTDLPATYEIDFYEGPTLRGQVTGLTTTTYDYTTALQTTDGFDTGDPITVNLYRVNTAYGRSRVMSATFQDNGVNMDIYKASGAVVYKPVPGASVIKESAAVIYKPVEGASITKGSAAVIWKPQ